jgi:hypothetical protein
MTKRKVLWEIVEVGSGDAFYDRKHNFIGQFGTFKHSTTWKKTGFKAGRFYFLTPVKVYGDEDFTSSDLYFCDIKLKRVSHPVMITPPADL